MNAPVFRLKIQQIEHTCVFELTWGRGQQLMTTLPYPDSLTGLYQEWRRLYLSFYKTVQMPLAPISPTNSNSDLRGRVVNTGTIAPSDVDWHTKLVEAETKLLNEFHRWLRSAELFEIRSAIARATRQDQVELPIVTVFLTCTPLTLARFPWEMWEIGADFAATGTIRMVRTPANIHAETTSVRPHRGRARILAIMGDETGLNFQADREAVRSLSRMADIHFLGWQPGQSPTEVKDNIRAAIADEQGWDVLFFAGHSNETQVTGGELAIAPGVSLVIQEIAAPLTTARERGLQFAIFNSCSGLNIAESLIDLGFSQVAIMREPIHNRVAQEFLIRFLQTLAEHKDVHEALISASQFLRLEKNLTYPSAYLVPSLFCHPDAVLFRIPPFGWRQRLQQSLPTQWEAIGLAVLLLVGTMPQTQQILLDWRVWTQAIYRDLTRQIPPADVPPVALVQIDEASIRRDDRIAKPVPINRTYLADLINQLTNQNAEIIGIDYLLDRSIGGEEILRQSLQRAIATNQTWFVFGTQFNQFEAENIFTAEEQGIAEREWSLQGHVFFFPRYVTLPYPEEDCRETCPFAYLMTLIQVAEQEQLADLPQPQLSSQRDLRLQAVNYIYPTSSTNSRLDQLWRSRLSSISSWSYEQLGLVWLEPIIDYSIPPDRIYDRVAAWRVLEGVELSNLPTQVVIIGAGEYTDGEGFDDQYELPSAVAYWRDRLPEDNNAARFSDGKSANTPSYLPKLTGVEAHAYMVHHLLNQRLVVPIPDIWLIGMTALISKVVTIGIQKRQFKWTRQQRLIGLTGATVLYGGVSLQLYISAAILVPWLLPSVTLWVYFLLNSKGKRHA
ncbi:CHASE2 domain-containing protein [Oscillatoria sp. FACHB-1407]|uniref:CHASE2 domain-containing protein n=1 Tax=Oscillatoria sp. FACHB-1407 TaxID=2692847 RepID=UPI0016844A18|nr:CHASE2 domain-containing protein [Oscillatoria sp. FACHB-1407]MBD2463042.1 CHASE2 domain-containing protein [Oscillatoria sp. FACHB-1407]